MLIVHLWLQTSLQNASQELSPDELETLTILSNGFADLVDLNPNLAYKLVVDMLLGVEGNENLRRALFRSSPSPSVPSDRQQHTKLLRDSLRHPSPRSSYEGKENDARRTSLQALGGGRTRTTSNNGGRQYLSPRTAVEVEDDSPSSDPDDSGSTASAASQQRGPIAEMLYSRWLEGLRRATGLY